MGIIIITEVVGNSSDKLYTNVLKCIYRQRADTLVRFSSHSLDNAGGSADGDL